MNSFTLKYITYFLCSINSFQSLMTQSQTNNTRPINKTVPNTLVNAELPYIMRAMPQSPVGCAATEAAAKMLAKTNADFIQITSIFDCTVILLFLKFPFGRSLCSFFDYF